jgi:predicted O-methyltransferase YrrM/SAM-dependent methyltransferase
MSAASDLLDRIYESRQVEAADGERIDAFPASLPRAHAGAIARLVQEHGLKSTLETGMAFGLSTLAICGVHDQRGEGSHVAIDPYQSRDWRGIGVLNLERAGLAQRARVIEARSDEALPRLRDEGLRIDFALIDGLHLFDATLVDFFHADRMLEVGGVVVFHDTWMPAVAQAVAYVRANRAYERLEAGDAAMIALRKLADDDRAWDFHRDFEGKPARATEAVANWLRPRIGTRRRRLETHRLKTRLERERLARRSDPRNRELLAAVDPAISPHDAMYTGDGTHYFAVGLSGLQCVEECLAATETAPPRSILDMPSGHGRVLRFLRSRYQGTALTACDLDEDGIAFCAEHFGAAPRRSSTNLEALELGGPFDLIWCGSLVTHLNEADNAALLALFARSLAADGVAVVTTHGSLVAERLREGAADAYQLDSAAAAGIVRAHDETGFGYADYSWSAGYGISISSPDWIAAAATAAGLRVAHAIPHGWDGHQDAFALVRR